MIALSWVATLAGTRWANAADLAHFARKLLHNRLCSIDCDSFAGANARNIWRRVATGPLATPTSEATFEARWTRTQVRLRGSATVRGPAAATTISTLGFGAAVPCVSFLLEPTAYRILTISRSLDRSGKHRQ